MSIAPIAFLPSPGLVDPAASAGRLAATANVMAHHTADAAGKTTDGAGLSFVDWMGSQVSQANGKLIESEQALQALATGDTSSLHHVMIGLEEARLGFQLVTQVRSRLLESYQEVMRMQL